MVHQREEFVPGLFVLSERAQHRARNGAGVLFLNTAHHHTEVTGLADNTHAFWNDRLLNRLRNLLRETLLNLQPPGEGVHDPWNLAQTEHFVLRQVGHMHLAKEGQEVMLAQTEKLDILDNYHLVVLD